MTIAVHGESAGVLPARPPIARDQAIKPRIALLALALVLASDGTAVAQQRPQPIHSTDQSQHHPHHTYHPGNLPPLRFPATAARYHQFITFMLGSVHKLIGKAGITQGDVDKYTLAVKDCASTVEADGVVTAAENQRCSDVMAANAPHPHPAR